MIDIKLIKSPKFNNITPQINRSLLNWGVDLKKYHIAKLTTGARSGRLYGKHRASAPGEYPAKKTGMLASSVGIENKNKILIFGEGAFYAKFLEYGTRKMAPRPHLERSVLAKIMDLQKKFDNGIRKVLS